MGMNDKNPEPGLFHTFFREEAAALFASPQPEAAAADEPRSAPRLPVLPAVRPAGDAEQRTFWRSLRFFLRSGKGGGILDAAQKPLAFPAALAPFRDQPFLDGNYPCWVGEGLEAGLVPVRELLPQTLMQFASAPEKAVILKANLPRLEQIVRDYAHTLRCARPSHEVWDICLNQFREQLALQGDEANTFAADLLNLQQLLPKSGWVMPFTPRVPLFLLSALVHDHIALYRRRMEGQVKYLRDRVQDLLAVEREKNPESHSAAQLEEAMDFAGNFLNFEEMSQLLPESGSTSLSKDRLERLEQAYEVLQNAETYLFAHSAVLVIDAELDAELTFEWDNCLPLALVQSAPAGQAARTAAQLFDEATGKAARFFAALRIAELEIENQYKPELHDDFFLHFDWRRFTEEELAACPPVILCTTSNRLLEEEWRDYSHILTSNRPVKTLALKQTAGSGPEDVAFRPEPGALTIAHRDAYVAQSAAVRPENLYQVLKEGMNGAFPALFHVLAPVSGTSILGNSAAVEGREFPGFVFDARKGPKWGSRFDIGDNPDQESDWPLVSFDFQTADGKEDKMEVRFTSADFAALNPAFSHFFQPVPAGQWTEDLVPLSDFLELSQADRYTKAPFIWMVNAEQELIKAAVAWPLVDICQERLDFWHFLQENAGVHSYHVEMATDRLREELESRHEAALDELKRAHETALKEAREAAAREAMEQLAAVLLDLDAGTLPVASPRPVSAPVATPAPEQIPEKIAEEPAPAKKEEAEEVLPAGEAWIESALCTSCNECININKKIFHYNANKQAIVADPKGGPFADIVKAAESCPVAIIHPGAPQNPDESGLEGLVKRADKFN
jgi:ferredoxin